MTALQLMTPDKAYKPNFTNPRLLNRAQIVLAWCTENLSTRTAVAVHNKELTSIFGGTDKSISVYLRNRLLLREGMYKPGVASFKYKLNEEGAEALRYMITSSSKDTDYVAPVAMTDAERLRKKYSLELLNLEFNYKRQSDRDWHPLQHIKRTDKAAFWAEYLPWNYDFEACAPTVLSQLAQKAGLNDLVQGQVLEYINDRGAFRKHVQELTGCEPAVAKRLINSLFNGARLSRSDLCQSYVLLEYDYQAMTRLMEDPKIKSLRLSIKFIWQKLGDIQGTSYQNSKQKWSLYFKFERAIMDVTQKFLASNQVKVFTEHDGFRTDKQVDKKALLAEIEKEVQLKMKLQEEYSSEAA